MKILSRGSIIALFFHRYKWGVQIRGDERGFFEKAKEFKKLGITLLVFEKEPSFQDATGEKAYRSLEVSGCRIPPRNPLELFVLTLLTVVRMFGVRTPSRPLAIYAYNQDVENTFLGMVLKILTGSPLVVIYHQIEASSVEPFGRSFSNRRKSGYGVISALWRSISPALNRFALSHADVHIALSKAAKDDVENAISTINCAVIGNGLDTEKFKILPLPKLYEAAFLGRLAPQKGIDILLRAWQEVVYQIPDAKLILIGGADESNFKKYRKMVEDFNLENNVFTPGFQSDEKVIEILNSSRLFVFPSRKEGFAQAVSQAMACGMCCVLSDIPPLREYYGKGAILVPPEDSHRLALMIIALLSDATGQNELRKQARETVMNFSWHETVKHELQVIIQNQRK